MPIEETSTDTPITPRSTWQGNSTNHYIVLGKKRNNPFEIGLINQTKNAMYGTNEPDKLSTHRYIKFSPTTQEHIAELEEWESTNQIALFDFPLEYEIAVDGETYIDPNVSDSLFTYQYASIINGVALPNVPNVTIENIYLDYSDPLLLAESFIASGNKSEVNEYLFKGGLSNSVVNSYDNTVTTALEIPDYPEDPCPPGYHWVLVVNDLPGPNEPRFIWICQENIPPPPPEKNDCGCDIPSNRNSPAGCVQVDNDGFFDPVIKASIKTRDKWFESDITSTDENGCWSINKSYSKNIWTWVRFKNENVKVRDIRYWVAARVIRDYVGRISSPPYNNILIQYTSGNQDNTSNPRMYWAAAHSLNTVNEYRVNAGIDGITLPRTKLNWTNRAGDGAAAAPMLQDNYYNSWPSLLFVLGGGTAIIEYVLISNLLPDIYMRYEVGDNAADFNGVGFHELGHASHHAIVGENYWIDYRNHIVNNGGYGAFDDFALGSDPGKVALGEAIGNFTGAIYGQTDDGGEGNEFENNFIPRGLMWDLSDIVDDEVFDPNDMTSFTENISGFTREMIFNSLSPNVENIQEFGDRLKFLHLANTSNSEVDFDALIDIYDVFN